MGIKPTSKPAPVAQTRSNIASKTSSVSNQQVEELSNQVMDMRLNLEGLEKERDFYFSKLRDIEILCQEAEDSETPIIQKILEILYATEVNVNNLIIRKNNCYNLKPLDFFRMVSHLQMSYSKKMKNIRVEIYRRIVPLNAIWKI